MASQSTRSPADDIPAATEYVPGTRPEPDQRPSCATRRATVWMKKSVDPYITIVSPTSRQPALYASASASIVPASTGVPARSPVAVAASVCSSPTTSPGHASRGRSSGAAQRSQPSGHQSSAFRS